MSLFNKTKSNTLYTLKKKKLCIDGHFNKMKINKKKHKKLAQNYFLKKQKQTKNDEKRNI